MVAFCSFWLKLPAFEMLGKDSVEYQCRSLKNFTYWKTLQPTVDAFPSCERQEGTITLVSMDTNGDLCVLISQEMISHYELQAKVRPIKPYSFAYGCKL